MTIYNWECNKFLYLELDTYNIIMYGNGILELGDAKLVMNINMNIFMNAHL